MLIEAAMVFPILITLVFGIIDFGIAFLNVGSVSSASRSGARTMTAASKQEGYQTAVLDAVKTDLQSLRSAVPLEVWLYKANPVDAGAHRGKPLNGDGAWNPNTQSCPASTCERWVYSTGTWTKYSGEWNASSQAACFVAPGASSSAVYPDTVGVFVKARYNYTTKLFGSSLELKEHTAMRLEPVPATKGCEAS